MGATFGRALGVCQEPGVSEVVMLHSGEGSGVENNERGLKDLHADLLIKILCLLPQKSRAEARLVSKTWEDVVTESSVLWRKVEVVRNWTTIDMQGRVGESQFARRVLGAAEEVQFSHLLRADDLLARAVERVFGVNLKILRIWGTCVYSTFFLHLNSYCPQLESLEVWSKPMGNDPVHIDHANLRILTFPPLASRSLTIQCCSLTQLGMSYYETRDHAIEHALCCPRLTSLDLISHHCVAGLLEAMAVQSPDIQQISISLSPQSSWSALRDFKSLWELRVGNYRGNPPYEFTQWPLLERVFLFGRFFTQNLVVHHPGLKSLLVHDWDGITSPFLACPLLENLELRGHIIGAGWLHNLTLTCPNLKNINVERWSRSEESGDSLELFHDTLETLELYSVSGSQWTPVNLVFLKLDFPNLVSLTLRALNGSTTCVPPLQSALPSLKSLKIMRAHMGWSTQVIDHSNIQNLVIEKGSMLGLELRSTSLVNVSIVKSTIRVLQGAHRQGLRLEVERCVGRKDEGLET